MIYKVLRTIVIAIVAICTTSSAYSAFIENRIKWNELTSIAKSAYVMGAFDGIYFVRDLDSDTERLSADIRNCVIELEIDNHAMVEIVEIEYRDLDKWDWPVIGALISGIRKVCLANVNRARAVRGEAPLH